MKTRKPRKRDNEEEKRKYSWKIRKRGEVNTALTSRGLNERDWLITLDTRLWETAGASCINRVYSACFTYQGEPNVTSFCYLVEFSPKSCDHMSTNARVSLYYTVEYFFHKC